MFIKKAYKDTKEFKDKQDKIRERWLNLMNENQDLSQIELKRLDEGLYNWLMKRDREWLYDNMPDIKDNYKPIDWNQRDEELLPKVKDIVRKMNEGKPERILWTTIGGRLGINGWFSKNKEKLPKIKAYLDNIEETLQDFHIRKIKWAIDELEKEGISITKWKIIEKSGVNIGYIVDIRDRLSDILRERGYDESLLS